MLIKAKKLSKVYGSGENQVVALDKVDLTVAPGDFISIIGPSGSGKSTLLHLLSGLDHPTSGSLTYDGQEIYTLPDKEPAVQSAAGADSPGEYPDASAAGQKAARRGLFEPVGGAAGHPEPPGPPSP